MEEKLEKKQLMEKYKKGTELMIQEYEELLLNEEWPEIRKLNKESKQLKQQDEKLSQKFEQLNIQQYNITKQKKLLQRNNNQKQNELNQKQNELNQQQNELDTKIGLLNKNQNELEEKLNKNKILLQRELQTLEKLQIKFIASNLNEKDEYKKKVSTFFKHIILDIKTTLMNNYSVSYSDFDFQANAETINNTYSELLKKLETNQIQEDKQKIQEDKQKITMKKIKILFTFCQQLELYDSLDNYTIEQNAQIENQQNNQQEILQNNVLNLTQSKLVKKTDTKSKKNNKDAESLAQSLQTILNNNKNQNMNFSKINANQFNANNLNTILFSGYQEILKLYNDINPNKNQNNNLYVIKENEENTSKIENNSTESNKNQNQDNNLIVNEEGEFSEIKDIISETKSLKQYNTIKFCYIDGNYCQALKECDKELQSQNNTDIFQNLKKEIIEHNKLAIENLYSNIDNRSYLSKDEYGKKINLYKQALTNCTMALQYNYDINSGDQKAFENLQVEIKQKKEELIS